MLHSMHENGISCTARLRVCATGSSTAAHGTRISPVTCPEPRTPTRRPISPARTAAAAIRFRPPRRSPPGHRWRASAPETLVVAYDEDTGWAARLWWLLRHFGHDGAAVIRLDAWHGPLRPDEESIERAEFVPRPRTDDVARSAGAARAARRPGDHARRRPRARALARRRRADRPGGRADPGRPEPLLPGRDAAAAGSARRRRARRLLRLRRDSLRRAARAAPRRTRRTRGSIRARGASGTRSGPWSAARRQSPRADARGAARFRSAARGRARARRPRAPRAAAAARRGAGSEPAGPR